MKKILLNLISALLIAFFIYADNYIYGFWGVIMLILLSGFITGILIQEKSWRQFFKNSIATSVLFGFVFSALFVFSVFISDKYFRENNFSDSSLFFFYIFSLTLIIHFYASIFGFTLKNCLNFLNKVKIRSL